MATKTAEERKEGREQLFLLWEHLRHERHMSEVFRLEAKRHDLEAARIEEKLLLVGAPPNERSA